MSRYVNTFIIRNGKFIRDFEEMYRESPDPWRQRQDYERDLLNNYALYSLSRLIGEKRIIIKKILDIGCADGYYAKKLLSLVNNKHSEYLGVDISNTAILRAKKSFPGRRVRYRVNDIRKFSKDFRSYFELIFSAKTLYYVAPEIDRAIKNIKAYLVPGGLLCFTYNQRKDSFSNRWLTYEKLRRKIIKLGLKEIIFVEINRFLDETFAFAIYEKTK